MARGRKQSPSPRSRKKISKEKRRQVRALVANLGAKETAKRLNISEQQLRNWEKGSGFLRANQSRKIKIELSKLPRTPEDDYERFRKVAQQVHMEQWRRMDLIHIRRNKGRGVFGYITVPLPTHEQFNAGLEEFIQKKKKYEAKGGKAEVAKHFGELIRILEQIGIESESIAWPGST